METYPAEEIKKYADFETIQSKKKKRKEGKKGKRDEETGRKKNRNQKEKDIEEGSAIPSSSVSRGKGGGAGRMAKCPSLLYHE
tara:strand:- start:429 stop:677 length:249 start_codon:yes stop_codon:yes gene_type:complete